MSLSQERVKFTLDLAKLILYINTCEGYTCALNEVKRTIEEAKLNAQQGDGISNSLHIEGLAADILLYKLGVYLKNTEDYLFIGTYWKSLDPLNCWGGDFKNVKRKDGNHFSRTYQGRK